MSHGYYYVCDNCRKTEQVQGITTTYSSYVHYNSPSNWKYFEGNNYCSMSCLKASVLTMDDDLSPVVIPKEIVKSKRKRITKRY